jgi:hypothetical protein
VQDWNLNDLTGTAQGDQQVAEMQRAARAWVTFYTTLRDGGVPLRLARRLTERQHVITCNLAMARLARAEREG